MSTLADELLNDFEDSGSEGEAQNGGLFPDHNEATTGLAHAPKVNGHGAMELDGDEENLEEDEEMTGVNDIDELDDEEATKAKVEKMQLGGVDDVRSVAGLMKTLEPVLEVSAVFISHLVFYERRFTSSLCNSPDYSSRLTENCIFSVTPAGQADYTYRLDRG